MSEIEERKQEEEEERLRIAELMEANAKEMALRNHAIETMERSYNAEFSVGMEHCASGTSPLVLDAVLTPLFEPVNSCLPDSPVHAAHCKQLLQSARRERDQALSLAKVYRDLAESCQSQKRILKTELETKIELVQDFWRNKVVEGNTRSGQILRAALIRD